jgi:hypothetical protein
MRYTIPREYCIIHTLRFQAALSSQAQLSKQKTEGLSHQAKNPKYCFKTQLFILQV